MSNCYHFPFSIFEIIAIVDFDFTIDFSEDFSLFVFETHLST